MIKRVLLPSLKWLTRVLVFTVLIVLLLVTMIVGTERGLRMVGQLANDNVPGLTLENIRGQLWKGISIETLQWQMQGLQVDLSNTYLQIDWASIENKRLHIDHLTSEQVLVAVDTQALAANSESEDPSEQTPEAELWTPPWPIELSELKLQEFALSLDDITVELNEFDLSANWNEQQISLEKLMLQRWLVAIGHSKAADPASSSADSQQDLAENSSNQDNLEQTIESELEETAELSSSSQSGLTQPDEQQADFRKMKIELPVIATPYSLNVKAVELNNGALELEGQRIELAQIKLQAQWIESQLNIDQLAVDASYDKEQLSLNLQGEQLLSGAYDTNLKLSSTANYQGLEQTLLLSIEGDQSKTLLDLESNGVASVNLEGELDWRELKLVHDLQLELSDINLNRFSQWFVLPDTLSQLKPQTVSLSSSGDLYGLDYKLNAVAQWLEQLQLSSEGRANLESLSDFKLSFLSIDQGENEPREQPQRLELAGDISWNDALILAIQGDFDHIDLRPWLTPFAELPEQELPILKGAVDVALNDQQWTAKTIEINSQWLDLPIALSANGQGTLEGIINDLALDIQVADNQVLAKGALSPQKMDLKGSLSANNLANLPWVEKGSVNGEFAVSGNYEQPDIQWDLKALGLSAYEVNIEQFISQAKLKLDDAFTGDVSATVSNVLVAEQRIENANLNFSSQSKVQTLKFNVNQGERSVSAELDGSGDANQWSGKLSQASLDAELGKWTLEQAMEIAFSSGVPSIGAHCWVQARSKLCLDQNLQIKDNLALKASLENFDFEILKPLLEQEIDMDMVANATVVANIADSKIVDANLNFSMPKGQVSLVDVDGESQSLSYEKLELLAKINNDQLRADLDFETADIGELKAWIETPMLGESKSLRGELEILPIQLQKFAPLVPDLHRLEGLVEAKIAIAGTLQQPRLNGLIEVSDTYVAGDQLPMDVDNLSTQIEFSEQKALIDGKFTSSNRPAKWQGEIDWSSGKPLGNVVFDADRLELLVPPMVSLVVSPEIKVSFGESVLDIRGEVLVNEGKIQVENVPQSALQASSDVIVIEEQIEGERTSQLMSLDITVNLGDDLQLLAMGLDTELTGSINVTQPPGKAMVGSGQIELEDGTFQAYAQSLVIEKGQLSFSGPLEEPYLDIRAIRNPNVTEDNVTAGITVLGPASSAKTELFSDPAMSQNEMLSYLLRGKGLDAAGDDNAFAAMLISAGLNQGSGVVGKVGDTLGLQDMSVGAAGAGNDTQVEVSAYVLPGVQVKYGMGVFEPINELTIRYEIMPRLFIEAFSGLDSALDIYYEFTTD